jgi:RNA polymerase sigma factor (sigma-70 family)
VTPRRLIEPARLAGGAVMRTQSDERLVDLVRAGNDRAFEAIVHRYSKPLLRYCRRFLPGTRAEDAVQQTLMNAYRAICADDRAIDLKPWLYRIAHNAALNALRAGAGAVTEPITEDIDGVERPDQAVERRERLAHVVAAVQALPPRQRDAIVLHELEGRSYDEIATELQVSGGAVRQLLSRARTTLRAGATAVVPEWVLVRLATSGGGESVAAHVAETVVAGGGAAALLKAGTAMVVAGAVVAGAAEGPIGTSGGGDRSKAHAAQVAAPAGADGGSAAASGATAVPIALNGNGIGAREPARGRRGSSSGSTGSSVDDRSGGGREGSHSSDDLGSDDGGGRSGSGHDDEPSRGGDDGHSGSGSDEPSDSSGSGRSGSPESSGRDDEPRTGSSGGSDDPPEAPEPLEDPVTAPVDDDPPSSNSGKGSLSSGSGSPDDDR